MLFYPKDPTIVVLFVNYIFGDEFKNSEYGVDEDADDMFQEVEDKMSTSINTPSMS